MIFSIILFAFCGIVGFFQYVQGFFSATISAICATVAAVIALGWYESVAPFSFGAHMSEQAASISLIVLFAVVYILPRLVIDSLVPGNVRMPVALEKVGAGVMGFIVGLIASGIVGVAADALPFGPTIGMYSRFTTSDLSNLTYMGKGQMQDSKAFDVIEDDTIDPAKAHGVWLGQDDLAVWLVKKASAETGSLSNDRSFTTVHPDLLDEYYGQRLGIQPGAKHTAVSTDQVQLAAVKGVYTPPEGRAIPQIDGEPTGMRVQGYTPPPAVVTPDADQIILILRVGFGGKDLADETDNLVRYSASSFRLVAGTPGEGFKNYFPVATLDDKGIAVACRPDDFLISESSTATVDFVFLVDRDHVMGADETKPPFHLPQGTFAEFKRYSVTDLSGQQVVYGPPPNPTKMPVLRVPSVQDQLKAMNGIWTGSTAVTAAPSGGSSSSALATPMPSADSGGNSGGAAPVGPSVSAGDRPLGESGLLFQEITASNKLAAPISCGTGEDEATVQLPNGVGGTLTGRKWSQLLVAADTSITSLGTPPADNVQELATDPNTTLVQVHCSAPVAGTPAQLWEWGKRVSDFEVADATGHTYPCVGVWAIVQRSAEHYFAANYKNFDDKHHLEALLQQKGRPVDVWLAFQVPSGTPIAELRFSGSTAMDGLNFKAQ